ncbi:MAG TPA: hypothetical protein VIJ14_06235, partial [Rhabdochlamydiaceae bacterium]
LGNSFPLTEAVTDAFYDALTREYPFDPNDPSMVSEEVWNNQKDAAVQHFMNDVSDLVDSIVNKLIQGEYHGS